MADVLVKSKEAIVIVIDVGRSTQYECRKIPTVLAKSKTCVSMILQRKIFSESKDEIALVLYGTHETANSLACDGSSNYKHIKVVQELQPACWDLLQFVNKIEGTEISSDLIKSNALLVAMNMLENALTGKKYFSRRILFLSNIEDLFYGENVSRICEGLKTAKIDLNLIGPFSLFDEEEDDCKVTVPDGKSPEEIKAQDIMYEILKKVNGEAYSFEEALPALIYYQKKHVNSLPWNANLDIGKNLTIPISAYIKIYESKAKPWKTAYAHKFNAKIDKETTYHLNDETQTEISKDNIIPAYRFGTTLVPFSEEDKVNMEYQSGEKGMKVLGFTKKENVHRYYYIGDKTMYVFGQKNRELAGVILAPFIHALHGTNMVAIVRYVYSSRSAPKIGFLAPRIKENYECLVYITLPFMEDLRHHIFPSLDSESSNLPSDDQITAVDELIDCMDLSLAAQDVEGNRGEGLKPKNTVNPNLQRVYQCLQSKIFRPDAPLPDLSAHVKHIIEPHKDLVKASQPIIEKMIRIFPLNESAKRKPTDTGTAIFPNGSTVESAVNKKPKTDKITEMIGPSDFRLIAVGTANPVEDFQSLLIVNDKLDWFRELCHQMERAILKLLLDVRITVHQAKVVACLHKYRATVLMRDEPGLYNSFIKRLKSTMIKRIPSLWKCILEDKLSLITTTECSPSTVSFEEASAFNNSNPEIGRDLRENDDDYEDDCVLLAEL